MASNRSSTFGSSKQDTSYKAKEAEQKRRDELAREKARLEKEAAALFGDDSFVTSKPTISSPKPPVSTPNSSTNNRTPSSSPVPPQNGSKHDSRPPTKITASTPVVTKKSASLPPSVPTSRTPSPSMPPSPIKKAAVTQAAPRKISVAPPVVKKTPAITPPPLPDIKYTSTSASNMLPSLAEWRAAVKSGKPLSTSMPTSRAASATESRRSNGDRGVGGRRRGEVDLEDEEGSDLDDFLASSDEDLESEDEVERRYTSKKRKANKEMDAMWDQLRAITGYNPNNAKFLERDKTALREATSEEAEREERQSRMLGRKEDADEEKIALRRAEEKARRLKEWRRRNGLPSDGEDDSDNGY